MGLEPVGTWIVPLLHETLKGRRNQLCTVRHIVRLRRLCRRDLQGCPPLRVAVKLQGQLGLLQPDEKVIQGLPVLLGKAELQGFLIIWPISLGHEKAEGVDIWIARLVQQGSVVAFVGDVRVQLCDYFLDNASNRQALLWHVALYQDVQPAVGGLINVHVAAADAQAAEKDPGAALALHAPVMHTSPTDDSAQHVGAIGALRQQGVQEDLLRPGVLVLWHGWRWLLRKLRCDVRLGRLPRGWRRHRRLCKRPFRRLHVENTHRQLVQISREEGVLLGQTLDELLHLLVVLSQVEILKTLELNDELLERGQNGSLFLCLL
mmetsp:Transcript_1954/g.4411  ORF Transcript_1954/g.4411 Transcript_1954/m.4411 type:complete len:319 (+) Transcript_1954:1454-2410(+)